MHNVNIWAVAGIGANKRGTTDLPGNSETVHTYKTFFLRTKV